LTINDCFPETNHLIDFYCPWVFSDPYRFFLQLLWKYPIRVSCMTATF